MTHQEIVQKLSLTCSADALYEITMETVIIAIVRHMGEEALELSAEDLALAKADVCATIDHYKQDILDILDIGIDAFFVLKDL